MTHSGSPTSTRPTVGLIGVGRIGSTIAKRLAAAGWDVVVSNSRGPASLTDLVHELGDRSRAATPEEAAAAGDVVVVSLPFDARSELPAQGLVGKTVIDTMNYYPGRDRRVAELDALTTTSSELLQRELPGSTVVKACNNVDFVRFASLPASTGGERRATLPICGDEPGALAEASAVLEAIGYGHVVLGGLADSWRQEPGTPVYVAPYYSEDSSVADAGQRFHAAAGKALTAEEVQQLADRATRSPAPTFPTGGRGD